jgi:hypothetical protein
LAIRLSKIGNCVSKIAKIAVVGEKNAKEMMIC